MGIQLLMGNLPVDTTEESVIDWIRDSNLEVQINVHSNSSGKCVGFATLTVRNEAEAALLVNDYDGAQFQGRIVYLNREQVKPPSLNWFDRLKTKFFLTSS